MTIKYVVYPGMVRSKNDGQWHYISASKLIMLFGVNPLECEIFDPKGWWPRSYHEQAAERHKELTVLQAQYDGNYTLPKEKV